MWVLVTNSGLLHMLITVEPSLQPFLSFQSVSVCLAIYHALAISVFSGNLTRASCVLVKNFTTKLYSPFIAKTLQGSGDFWSWSTCILHYEMTRTLGNGIDWMLWFEEAPVSPHKVVEPLGCGALLKKVVHQWWPWDFIVQCPFQSAACLLMLTCVTSHLRLLPQWWIVSSNCEPLGPFPISCFLPGIWSQHQQLTNAVSACSVKEAC